MHSWVLSVLIHGCAVGTAVIALTDLKLIPQTEPFKWDISVIEPAPQRKATTVSHPTPSPPAPAQPVESQPVESQPIVQTAQTVQTVQQVVQQEVRIVTPLVQAAPQPVVQAMPQPMEVIARTAQPIEPVASPQETATESAPPTPVISEPASSVVTSTSVTQLPVRSAPTPRRDYGWLAESLWGKVEQLKRYPLLARLNRWEGKVVLRAVIKDTGEIAELSIAQSSGRAILDEDALELVRQISPVPLKHPLGQPQITVQIPINYKLQ